MDVEYFSKIVKKELPPNRWEHTLRVVAMALSLGKKYALPLDKLQIAALFHDYCKYFEKEKLIYYIIKFAIPSSYLLYDQELWHGPVAANFVKDKFQIDDLNIFNAIYFHTTGRPKMTLFEQVIYLADTLEPKRDFEGVEELRELAFSAIDKAMYLALDKSIYFLLTKKRKIFPLTVATRNYFLERVISKTSS